MQVIQNRKLENLAGLRCPSREGNGSGGSPVVVFVKGNLWMIQADLKNYVDNHFDEAIDLLRTLGKIPAPSHQEDKRAEFCRDWFMSQGAKQVEIDEAKNVICTIAGRKVDEYVVIMAHTDVVFSDTEELPMHEEDGKLFAPGIGDDTANLVNLMMAVKYLLEKKITPLQTLIFVANACEEGLGNLKGSKQILKDYGLSIKEWLSFDGHMGACTDRAVGSHRYQVTVRTQGGHSYGDFGRDNSIAVLAEMIHDLYQVEVPKREKTTYNVGVIEGGSTVNSIAQKASMLYEFRSADQSCLEEMKGKFNAVIEKYRNRGYDVEVEIIGIRPGSGTVDAAKLQALTDADVDVIKACYDGKVSVHPGSTDANIPLSVGIPANTFGTVSGDLSHTREEWIEIESMRPGFLIALMTVMRYCS